MLVESNGPEKRTITPAVANRMRISAHRQGFIGRSRTELRRDELERVFDTWAMQPQPIRFYAWALWMHLSSVLWVYFRTTHWLRKRRWEKRTKGFVEFTLPLIRAPFPDVMHILASVQPMTKPASMAFYVNMITKDMLRIASPRPTNWWGLIWKQKETAVVRDTRGVLW